ncbi:signal peptidase I [Microlunatus panaciterrae]|nr:signal peptidase I [Microlunatus panaciterrae]
MTFGQHVLAFAKELVVVVIGAVIVASLLRGFVGQMFLIPSSSMENTLLINDRVAVEKISSVKRGEVVVFADPGGWLSGPAPAERGPVGRALEFVGVLPDTGTEHLIKRVIGLPGDEVICCDDKGRITVNGQALDESGYLYRAADGTQVAPSEIPFDVVVPADRMFVMGDHRNNSRDSRCHLNDERSGGPKGLNGFVSLDLVVGRGFAVVWPLSSASRLRIPATFDTVPPGKKPAPAQPQIDAGPEASC